MALKKRSLLSIFLITAVVLRLIGIWHDYPFSFYPDEAHFVKRALAMGSFDFNPHWFHKPAFYMYVLAGEYGIFFLIGKILSLWNSVSDFAITYVINPGPFYIIGRLTTVLFGVASIFVTYLLGEKHFKKNVGLIGALLLILTYAHINSCQVIKADIPSSFFGVLSALFMLNYFNDRQVKQIFWSAAFAGIGTATKTYPEIMIVPITLTIILVAFSEEKPKNLIRTIMVRGIITIAIFWFFYFLCSPYSFLDSLGREAIFHDIILLYEKVSGFFRESSFEDRPDNFISCQTTLLQGFIDYAQVLFHNKSMGLPIAAISMSGVLVLIFNLDQRKMLFLLFPVLLVCLSVYTFPGYAEPRHQLPIYPFLAVAGGFFVVWLAGKNVTRQKFVYALLLVSLCWPLFNIIQRGRVQYKKVIFFR